MQRLGIKTSPDGAADASVSARPVRRLVPASLPAADHRYDLGQRVTPPAGRAVPCVSGGVRRRDRRCGADGGAAESPVRQCVQCGGADTGDLGIA